VRTGKAPRVVVCEPNEDVRELIVTSVRQLGYEPLVYDPEAGGPLPEGDVIVLEPASDEHLRAAQRLQRRGRTAPPIVSLSIYAPQERPNAFPVAAHVTKPFSLRELQGALAAALPASG
jgi:CheY-like chemotaxis protein